MWPKVIQFETRQMELEAELRLYGEREARAQSELAEARVAGSGRRDGRAGGLLARRRDGASAGLAAC
jgi:hypothetical protein